MGARVLLWMRAALSLSRQAIAFSILTTGMALGASEDREMKYHPGHYVAIQASESVEDIRHLDERPLHPAKNEEPWLVKRNVSFDMDSIICNMYFWISKTTHARFNAV